jgi:O-antigen ligase
MSTISQSRVPLAAQAPIADLAVRGASRDVLSRLGFITFLLVNATLFIRPAELLASLEGWPIYEALIILCLLASLPSVMHELSPGQLRRWPITLCVVALLPVVALSQITHLHFEEATTGSTLFFKLVAYYLLLLVNLNSLKRLRIFLFSIMTVTLLMTTLSVLEYHQLIDMPVLSAMHQTQSDPLDAESSDDGDLARLSSLGIFDNPNDLSRIVVVAVFLCMICLSDRWFGLFRFLWAAPVAFLIYANVLTYSRGGFLGLLGGLGAQFLAQYGRFRTILLAGAVLPILLVVSAGRQTNISTNAETGHARILLWRDGFEAMHTAPIFGTGIDSYPDITGGLVAHNSFVHAFTELGLIGGTLFVGLFYFSIEPLYRVRKYPFHAKDREFYRLLPYIIGIVVSYGVGLLSSSRCYEVPTFMIIGLASVCARLAAAREPRVVEPLNRRTLKKLVFVSLTVLIGHYIFVRLNA